MNFRQSVYRSFCLSSEKSILNKSFVIPQRPTSYFSRLIQSQNSFSSIFFNRH
nr:MAG TPA: calcium uniporter protein [Caudoviricetes sp.]